MSWRIAIVTLAASVCAASAATAQQCIGLPWRGDGALRLGAVVVQSSAGSGFGIRPGTAVALPSRGSIFVDVTGTRVTPADDPALVARGAATNPAYGVVGDLGLELPVGRRGAISVCPTAGVAYTSGPERLIPDPPRSAEDPGGELEVEGATLGWLAGGWLGGTLQRGGWRLVPALGVHVVRDRVTTSAEGRENGEQVDDSETRSVTWARLSLAAGMGIGEALSLLPRVTLPVSASGPRATTLTVTLSTRLTW